MKRSKHSLSHYVLATFDMGRLIPVGNFEVLPGDSVRMSSSCLLRVSPLMTPVMHPVSVRVHHWFVPYRVLWDDWEDFITGGPDGQGAGTPFPVLLTGPQWDEKGLGNYFGIPIHGTTAFEVSALPFRAYNKIYNENYRDADLCPVVAEDSIEVQKIAWEKDYFTAARPWTQKGPAVTLPLGVSAPVKGIGINASTAAAALGQTYKESDNTSRPYAQGWLGNNVNTVGVEGIGNFPNIYADLQQATGAEVNDMRRAFALQRYQEARAQYGSRYTEYLRYLGVRSSDARLQRPEYLGGGRATITFSEVLRTGNESTQTGGDAPIGEMRGHGISAMRSRSFIRFFEEHGIVMTLASIRPRSMYTDGLHRQWSRRTKEDFWQKELELIGQQEVYNREVYADQVTGDAVFGYGDRYSEYRHHPSYVCGEFRTTMNDWHLARSFAAPPALNASFVECDPSKRIHAEQTQDVIWGMFSHSIQARRMVGHRTIGRII